jgi:hypothetical protein
MIPTQRVPVKGRRSLVGAGGTIAFVLGISGVLLLPSLRTGAFTGIFLAGEGAFGIGIALALVGMGIEAWRAPQAILPRPAAWLRQLRGAAATSDVVLGGVALAMAGTLLYPVALLLTASDGSLTGGQDTMPLANVAAACLAGAPLLAAMRRRRRAASTPAP